MQWAALLETLKAHETMQSHITNMNTNVLTAFSQWIQVFLGFYWFIQDGKYLGCCIKVFKTIHWILYKFFYFLEKEMLMKNSGS